MSINRINDRCDCCGTPYNMPQEDCSNCGYPLDLKKETAFLRFSIHDLERVAHYNGGELTIWGLVRRYRQRLSYLNQVERQRDVQSQGIVSLPASTREPAQNAASPSAREPEPTLNLATSAMENHSSIPVPTTPKRAFSFHSFFADQSINIVASLGAFLILVSSLSFVATEPNTLLAFVVLLSVHVFFGLTGAFTFRFPSVRIVSVIYTAIFALQVPLVGFAFYDLVNTKFLQISPAALIASVAIYAMITYGALAIYQHFKPFGYFAAVSLAIADLATSWAFHLPVGWWFCTLFFLAFPLLLFVLSPDQTVRRSGAWEILRNPARVLMYACVYGSCSFSVLTFLILNTLDPLTVSGDMRFSIAVLAVFLLIWMCLFIWRVQHYTLAQFVPYLFLVALCLWLYAYMAHTTAYIIAFTLLGICYWTLTRRISSFSWPVKPVINQLEIIVISLALLVALLSDPLLMLQMLSRSYGAFFRLALPPWLLVDVIAILIGGLLVFGISINHVGWRKAPEANRRGWCWLVLLSGLLFNYAYGIILLWSALPFLWGLFAFALLCVGLTYMVRRLTTQDWAYPLALLSLCVAVESLLLGLDASLENLALILLFYILSSYFLATYLRLLSWLSTPVAFAILSLLFIQHIPQLLFVLSIISPFIIVCFYRWRKSHPLVSSVQPGINNSWLSSHPYAWPAFLIGLLYSSAFILSEIISGTSALSLWLDIPDAFAAEMALLAVLWYVSAVLAQKKWLLVVSTVCAGVAIQFPALPFWFLVGLAIGLIIIAVLVRSKAGSDWTLPFYLMAILAAVMMDRNGSVAGLSLAAAWMLLLFAGLTYLAGLLFEKDKRIQFGLLWSFAVLTCWSLYVVSLLGDFYRLPLFTLAFASIGVGMHSIRHHATDANHSTRRLELSQIFPLYTVACFASLLTGLSGMFNGINIPFYGAVPLVLFVYALIAYGITLFEREALGLWLVAIFALWGMLLFSTQDACTSIAYFLPFGQVDCAMQLQLVPYCLASMVFVCCVLGMFGTRLLQRWVPSPLAKLSGWVWYGIALAAVGITCVWGEVHWTLIPHTPIIIMLAFFIGLTVLVMIVERIHELILLVGILSIWMIAHLALPLWLQLGLCCVLFVLIFASQFIWRYIPSYSFNLSATRMAQLTALGGQFLVICVAIGAGGLFSSSGPLAQVGAVSLLVFTLLLVWFGMLQKHSEQRRLAWYTAGFFFSLVVTWELLAFALTDFSLLCTSPAVYLIVISPFISKDESLLDHSRLGQICSFVGAALLLGPTLWLSFDYNNVATSFLLAGESLVLLLLGFITLVRFFVLSATAIIIVATIHLLFLPSFGIPTFLALFLVGIFLIILATVLLFIRSRLTAFWSRAS